MDKEGYRRKIRLSPAWDKNEDNKEKKLRRANDTDL